MASNIGLAFIILLNFAFPSLTFSAVFNWKHLGSAQDTALRFVGEKAKDVTVVKPQSPDAGQLTSPAFCNGLDCPQYIIVDNKTDYQLREYNASTWVSTTSVGIDYDKASHDDFMRLFDYIRGKNQKDEKIAMTAPVLNRIIPGQGPACEDNFTMSFFMSPKEGIPPKPSESTVFLSQMPVMKVYVRYFPGYASKQDWLEQAELLAKDLKGTGAKYHTDFYYTAGYNSPFQFLNRHNEIWFIAKN